MIFITLDQYSSYQMFSLTIFAQNLDKFSEEEPDHGSDLGSMAGLQLQGLRVERKHHCVRSMEFH